MHARVLVFAGTSEGREIAEYLAENGITVTACVATEYGSMVIPANKRIEVRTGRLTQGQMEEIIMGYSFIIDATHPYAELVTKNIKAACLNSNKEYIRLWRPSIADSSVVPVADSRAAAQYLDTVEGNVLLTTGSKELESFSSVRNFDKRLFARVLPTPEVVNKCVQLGYRGKNLICMQGPFSQDMNLAMLKQINARFIVTKDSGMEGGFEEKISAAKAAGVTVILITRPSELPGLTLEQLKKEVSERFNFRVALTERTQNKRFPLFIDISEKKVLVVGGGEIAARRVKVLCNFGADVFLVAPELSQELQDMQRAANFSYIKDRYSSNYMEDKFMAIASTNDRSVNHQVFLDAQQRKVPVSVADCREECSFYFPAVFEFDGIVGGLVSETGNQHALVRATAEKIRSIGDSHQRKS